VGFIGAIIGGFSTYLAQKRIQERAWEKESAQKMVDTIYGPLFREINKTHESLEASDEPHVEKLEKIRDHYLYFTIDEKLREDVDAVYNLIKRYLGLYEAAKRSAEHIALEEARRNLVDRKATPDVEVRYQLFVGNHFVNVISLPEALLKSKTPKALLEEQTRGFVQARIDVTVGGYKYPDNEAVHKVCENALERTKKDPIIQGRNRERETLLQEAEKVIEKLKPLIKT